MRLGMLFEYLEQITPFNNQQLKNVCYTASRRYVHYTIDKRNKQGGKRNIYHPARELKYIQRIIVRDLLSRLPIHFTATAYKEKISIFHNALIHKDSDYLLKLDFTNFFPSISNEVIKRHILNNKHLVPDDLESNIDELCLFVCRNNVLTIGAPSSPFLSNTVMYKFDQKLNRYLSRRRIKYTRYADDLFLSTTRKNILSEAHEFIRELILNEEYSFLKLNEHKTYNASRAFSRKVTGLTITPDKKISIGREKKKHIKKLLHKWTLNQLNEERN